MVGKITKGIFTSVYFRASILILLCFFAATWYVNKRVEKEAIDRVNAMTANVGINNIQIVVNTLNDYAEKLLFLKAALTDIDNKDILQKAIKHIQNTDSSINNISIEPLDILPAYQNNVRCLILKKDEGLFLQFTLPIDTDRQLALLVDLMKFHQKLAESKNLNYAYITITDNDIYLYHPNEKKIGEKITIQDRSIEEKVLLSQKDTIANLNSDYLDIPVYSYYSLQNINGNQWIFTANMPNLGLSDSIRNTGNGFMIISLLAIFSFIAVFSLGIIRWRKEFIRRKEIEQQNMSLLLKNEQHKQTMIATELERLKSGLNPHFLFNSLGSLRVLVSKDAEVAKNFAITLSNVYRYMLKQENQNTVTLREELEFTENYINLQKIRFANKIITNISLPPQLLDRMVLPISLQLLVENCIKHTQISDDNPLNIHIFSEGDMLVVMNNYNPREPEADYSGKGIDNLIKRYYFLTQTECKFEIANRYYFAKIPTLLFP